MKIDIITAISGEPINNIRAVCSTLPTGETAKLLFRNNYPADLTISSIENKFAERFDDPSYYYGSSGLDGGNIGGNTDASGDVLGV